jgi:hypothetical protein
MLQALPQQRILGVAVDGRGVLHGVGANDSAPLQVGQRLGGARQVTLNPPLGDAARRVRRLGVAGEIANDLEADRIALEQLADRRQPCSRTRDDRVPFSM